MTMMVSPQPALTSTSTGCASMPLTAADRTLANVPAPMRLVMGKLPPERNEFLENNYSGNTTGTDIEFRR